MTIRGVSNKYRALYYHPLDLTPETLLTQAFIQSVSNLTDGHRPGAVGSDWGWTRAFDILSVSSPAVGFPVYDWSVMRIYPRFLRLIGPYQALALTPHLRSWVALTRAHLSNQSYPGVDDRPVKCNLIC
eukprot:1138077-Prorocentrum_minimum.AAC.1